MSNELYELFNESGVSHGDILTMVAEDGETHTEVQVLGYIAENTGSNAILAGIGQRGDGRYVVFSWNVTYGWEIDASRQEAWSLLDVVGYRVGGTATLTDICLIWVSPLPLRSGRRPRNDKQ